MRLANSILPCKNQGMCNSHFCSKLSRREIFRLPVGLNPFANRLYALLQRFMLLPTVGELGAFCQNPTLCNTQHEYSPPGEDFTWQCYRPLVCLSLQSSCSYIRVEQGEISGI